ncbi:MAG: glycerophosphodiester phosphodiesterase [Chloroflexi bacterium]|nr:glycerophosphodiester phosphodiesterase [Chloroflexota bacterium]
MSNTVNFCFEKLSPQDRNEPARAWQKEFIRIGHSGASGHAPANTLKSLNLGLEMGVDMIEFDVRPCLDALVLLHDDDLSHLSRSHQGLLASKTPLSVVQSLDLGEGERIPTLDEALDLVQGRALINIDLKAAGYERSTVQRIRDRQMLTSTLISSLIPESLRQVRSESTAVKTGLSYPADKGNASRRPALQPVVNIVVALMKRTLPYRVVGMMAKAQANAVMLNYRLVSKVVVAAVHRHQGRVFVWTIDEPELLQSVYAMDVDGIASNYPEQFRSLPLQAGY